MKIQRKNSHIFYHAEDRPLKEGTPINIGWYFWDEIGDLGGGPYKNANEAMAAFERYAESLNESK